MRKIASEYAPEDNQYIKFLAIGGIKQNFGRYNKSLNIVEGKYAFFNYTDVEYWEPIYEKLYNILIDDSNDKHEGLIFVPLAKELSKVILKELKEKAGKILLQKEFNKNFVILNKNEIVAIRTDKEIVFYDALELTNSWLNTSNDAFFEAYGFNWVPPIYLRDKLENKLQSTITDTNTINFENNSNQHSYKLFTEKEILIKEFEKNILNPLNNTMMYGS